MLSCDCTLAPARFMLCCLAVPSARYSVLLALMFNLYVSAHLCVSSASRWASAAFFATSAMSSAYSSQFICAPSSIVMPVFMPSSLFANLSGTRLKRVGEVHAPYLTPFSMVNG